MNILKNLAYWLGLPIILILIWHFATMGDISPFVPRPLPLWEKFVSVWLGENLLTDVLPSIGRLLLALAISIVLGVVLGVLIGSFRSARWFFEPLFEFLRAIPSTIMIPVLLLVVGLNDNMRITVIVLGSIWPVLLNTITGVRSLDEVLSNSAKVYGVHGWGRVWHLVLPGASPAIMAGVRQSLAVGLILMVVSEMFASANGIGTLITNFQNRVAVPEMWSGVLLLGVVGVVLSAIFALVQKGVLKWYDGLKAAADGN
ncbi:ABC transporter permease [Microbacterium suwonense]|uniref:Nitrate ABC transporter permease n=1 Tax=Microbacterium suwonense TaxID=683047 RepID=A0ABM8FUC0_9MICO|nr:ABC transporter permease [Microbacterium suwonense]BDZ39275.1 nitrate ABC transporter permease [Microbacterium suwonense]